MRRPWTEAEIATLRRLFATHSAAEIGAAIGRSVASIHNKRLDLGLRKPREWISARLRVSWQAADHGGRRTQFQPGHRTWNAGMKGLHLSPNSQFKPGHRPHTWLPIGATRVTKDGYVQRKISDTGQRKTDFVPVHHLVWRLHGRIVPPGHALVFRDGNKRNFDINNLELVTRAELMARNTVHNLPEPIKQVVVLHRTLTRSITLKERHAQAHD